MNEPCVIDINALTCILLLQLLYVALAVPQLHLVLDHHIFQLLQLSPDIRGDVSLITGCFDTQDLRLNLSLSDWHMQGAVYNNINFIYFTVMLISH